MTIAERPGAGSAVPSSAAGAPDAAPSATAASSPGNVPNAAAQRAYAASIAPPPRPALPAEMTSRARRAGGIGGAVMLVGLDLAVLGILLLVLPLVVERFVAWLGSLEPDADPAVALSVEQLFDGPWPWIASLVLVVGLAALASGTAVSIRTLRGAGFPRPVRLTFAAFGVALGVRIVLNVFTAPFSSLLSPLLERGVAGIAVGGMEAVGTIVAIVIACGMNVAIAAAIGMVTWWFLASATRPAAPPPEPVEPSWTTQLKVHHIPH